MHVQTPSPIIQRMIILKIISAKPVIDSATQYSAFQNTKNLVNFFMDIPKSKNYKTCFVKIQSLSELSIPFQLPKRKIQNTVRDIQEINVIRNVPDNIVKVANTAIMNYEDLTFEPQDCKVITLPRLDNLPKWPKDVGKVCSKDRFSARID